MTLDAVCFDLDDTLYDYRHYARAGLRSAADRLQALTGHDLHDELFELYFDRSVTEGTFDELLARHDLPAHLVEDLVDAFHDSAESITPYVEAERVLSRLESSYRLGLLTDGRGGHAKLDRLGLEPYFDAVVVTPAIDASKRDRSVFDRVLAELDTPPENAAYVGDDPRVDFRHPNRSGMLTVRLRRGRYTHLEPADPEDTPDHEIDSLAALHPVLKRADPDRPYDHRRRC